MERPQRIWETERSAHRCESLVIKMVFAKPPPGLVEVDFYSSLVIASSVNKSQVAW